MNLKDTVDYCLSCLAYWIGMFGLKPPKKNFVQLYGTVDEFIAAHSNWSNIKLSHWRVTSGMNARSVWYTGTNPIPATPVNSFSNIIWKTTSCFHCSSRYNFKVKTIQIHTTSVKNSTYNSRLFAAESKVFLKISFTTLSPNINSMEFFDSSNISFCPRPRY